MKPMLVKNKIVIKNNLGLLAVITPSFLLDGLGNYAKDILQGIVGKGSEMGILCTKYILLLITIFYIDNDNTFFKLKTMGVFLYF